MIFELLEQYRSVLVGRLATSPFILKNHNFIKNLQETILYYFSRSYIFSYFSSISTVQSVLILGYFKLNLCDVIEKARKRENNSVMSRREEKYTTWNKRYDC